MRGLLRSGTPCADGSDGHQPRTSQRPEALIRPLEGPGSRGPCLVMRRAEAALRLRVPQRDKQHSASAVHRSDWRRCGSLSRHDLTRKRPQREARKADLAPDTRRRPAAGRIRSLLIRKRSQVRVQDRPLRRKPCKRRLCGSAARREEQGCESHAVSGIVSCPRGSVGSGGQRRRV